MKKIMTIVGTRPELIKLSRVIPELDTHTEHILVHTGQNYDYELNEVFFKELNIRKPDYFLEAAGKTAAETIGNVIAKIDPILEKEDPDAVLVYGDTNSCLAVISAKRRRIPVFHMEAGNRCFDQRVPEELNRRIIDHISDINMTITEHARQYLIMEGIRPETIIKTGSSILEVLTGCQEQIEKSDVLKRLELTQGEFLVVSAHREENVDDEENFNDLILTLNKLAETYRKKIIVSTHPRTRKKLEAAGTECGPLVTFLKPLGYFDYITLQKNAFCTVSDSGTITEESSILGFPAVTIRQAHERPEGMDEGTLIMCGLKHENVIDAINIVTGQVTKDPDVICRVPDYIVDNVSVKVVRIIVSYIDYIKRTVWTDKPAYFMKGR